MGWTIVEDRTPKKCCARCGATPAEVKKMGWDCTHWGVRYDNHIWINWKPEPTEGGESWQGCHAGRDGDCIHVECPQLRDGEPAATGRHCPLDVEPHRSER